MSLILSDSIFSREWLAEQLARRLVIAPDRDVPQFVHPPESEPIPAAVLMPVINRAHGPTLMFTQRTTHLHDHAGQISFPGGRVDQRDRDHETTALRETEEETGLERTRVQIVGRLPFEARPDPFEVEEVFEVPLEFFLDPANHQAHAREVNGTLRYYYAMPYEDYYIWGATAGMLRMLYHALAGSV